jgi:hypothetical protein
MTPRSDVAKALWITLVECYGQGGRTKVELPLGDVLTALCALQANVISLAPTRTERRALQRAVPGMIDHMLKATDDRPNNHIWSKGNGLVLP